MSTPLFLANNFIKKALTEGISLSPMKLQKLIYFTYRNYYQATRKKLFSEPIETWQYGPVVEVVYAHFKPYGARSVDKFYRNSAGETLMLDESVPEVGSAICNVWERYKSYSGTTLSQITHQDGGAWQKANDRGSIYLSDEDILDDRVG